MKENLGPNIEKIVVNVSVGRMAQHSQFAQKGLPQIIDDLKRITGQAPQTRPARKSIAGFKVREGDIVGVRVTLRRQRMIDFFNRLITMVLPRVRDFRGIDPATIDKNGNLTIGIRDHFVFPETNADSSTTDFGLQVTVVPQKKMRHHDAAFQMYKEAGVPLKLK